MIIVSCCWPACLSDDQWNKSTTTDLRNCAFCALIITAETITRLVWLMHGNQKFSNFLEPCSDIDNDSEQQIIDFVLFCFVMYFFFGFIFMSVWKLFIWLLLYKRSYICESYQHLTYHLSYKHQQIKVWRSNWKFCELLYKTQTSELYLDRVYSRNSVEWTDRMLACREIVSDWCKFADAPWYHSHKSSSMRSMHPTRWRIYLLNAIFRLGALNS